MRLDRAVVKNFLTYENLDYNFSRNPLLVQGRNLTEEDQESNGSGKSGLFTAIEFCITASNSRDVRDNELVMFGEKQANAELYASCDIRKEQLHIAWLIKVKGSNVLTLKKKSYDGEWEEISFSNVNDGKKYIMNWFDIEKEDLFNYYIINKSRFKTFFKASNKEKVELINRFSDASIIDGLDKVDNSELQLEYDTIKSNIDKVVGKVEFITQQLTQEEEVIDESQLVKDIQDKISQVNDDKLDVQDEIKEFDQKKSDDAKLLKDAEGKLAAIDVKVSMAQKAFDNYKTQLISTTDQEDQIDTLSTKQLKVDKLLNELDIELSGSIECPKCSYEFVLDSKHGSIEQAKQKQSQACEIRKTISSKIDQLDVEISNIQSSNKEQEDKRQKLRDDLNQASTQSQSSSRQVLRYEKLIAEHDKDIADCNNDLKQFDLDIKQLNIDIKNVGSTKPNNKENFEEQLSKLSTEQKDLEEELSTKGDEIYKRNQWANNFKQFRAHLANQSLEAIEFHMNRYLDGMDSDLKVKMEGFKLLANGTFKDEITAKIIRTVERSFSSFSGGEQGRLLFAAILANRHMLNSTHKYGGLDFLSIDEVFEGVDSLGLKKLVKSAKQLDISVMIITHVTDEEVSDDILLIEKINGISYVKK
jgi:exonuclease SbcC